MASVWTMVGFLVGGIGFFLLVGISLLRNNDPDSGKGFLGMLLIVVGSMLVLSAAVMAAAIPISQLSAAKSLPYRLAEVNRTILQSEELLASYQDTAPIGSGIAAAAEGLKIKQQLISFYAQRNALIKTIAFNISGRNPWWLGFKIQLLPGQDKLISSALSTS